MSGSELVVLNEAIEGLAAVAVDDRGPDHRPPANAPPGRAAA